MTVRLPLLAQPIEEPIPKRRERRTPLDCIAVSDAVTGSRTGRTFLAHLIAAFPGQPTIVTSHAALAREVSGAKVLVVTEGSEVDAVVSCDLSYGLLVPARREPKLHVMLTSGALISSWSKAAVQMRDRVDVLLSDPREVFAQRVLARLLDERS